MKKVLYLTTVDKDNDPGVYKKLISQVESFERLGCRVHTTFFSNGMFCFDGEPMFEMKRGVFDKVMDRFLYSKDIMSLVLSHKWDMVYIRKTFINPGFISLVSQLKRRGVAVVLEIPTYPYFGEIQGRIKRLLHKYEVYSARRLPGKIDYITYFGEAGATIWSIPALKLNNGIDVNSLSMKKVNSNTEVIHFIGVANLASWHYYERFIRSMSNLSDELKYRVHFNIVGSGASLDELKVETEKHNLQSHVTFHGIKFGEDLADVFNMSHVGIDALGMFKVGFESTSSLKTKEYTARGLPFILACKDEAFPDDANFIFKVPNDHSLIDIESIISWFESGSFNPEEIKEFAQENLGWDTQMKKVIERSFSNSQSN